MRFNPLLVRLRPTDKSYLYNKLCKLLSKFQFRNGKALTTYLRRAEHSRGYLSFQFRNGKALTWIG